MSDLSKREQIALAVYGHLLGDGAEIGSHNYIAQCAERAVYAADTLLCKLEGTVRLPPPPGANLR